MTALVKRRRQRTALALVAGLVVACIVPVAVVVGARAIANSKAAVNVGPVEARQIPSTPVAYFATADDEGQLTSITVFTLSPGGSGGSMISVPVGMLVELGTDEENLEIVRLADVYLRYGAEGFRMSLEGALQVSFVAGEVVDRDDAARYLAPVPQLTVTFPVDVVDTTAEGDVVVRAAGEHQLMPGGVADVLLAREAGQPESARLPSLRLLWDSVAVAVGVGQPVSGDPLGAGAAWDLRTFMQATFSGPVSSYQFAYTPVVPDEPTADAPDLYRLDIAEVILVFAMVAPSSVVAANPSVTVQLDSVYDFDTTRDAVTRLIFAGANVLLVRQIEGDAPPTTIIRTAVRLNEQETTALGGLFGGLVYEEQTDRVEGIDIQVILGEEFIDLLDQLAAERGLDEGLEDGLVEDEPEVDGFLEGVVGDEFEDVAEEAGTE